MVDGTSCRTLSAGYPVIPSAAHITIVQDGTGKIVKAYRDGEPIDTDDPEALQLLAAFRPHPAPASGDE